MAASAGKGGGRRKVFYTAVCHERRHGKPGYKSNAGWWFVGVSVPRHKRERNSGCPQCAAGK